MKNRGVSILDPGVLQHAERDGGRPAVWPHSQMICVN